MIVRSTLVELMLQPRQLIGVGLKNFALSLCDLEFLDACVQRDAQLPDVVLAGGQHRSVLAIQTVERVL